MPTVFVTGGAGFIGSHTCKALAAHGFLPIAFDDLSRGHADFVRWGPLVKGNMLDLGALNAAFERHRPSAVIHFAALAYVGESMSRPLPCYRVNVAGLLNVLDAMLRYGTSIIVFSSSCATYGIPDRLPIAATAPQRPINPYGRSKLAGEQILADALSAEGLRVAILRYFNAAGADPAGELVGRHNPETHLVPLAIEAATGRGPALQIFGTDYPTADGTCERGFVPVSDLAAAHVEGLRSLDTVIFWLIVNLVRAHPTSVLNIITGVARGPVRAVRGVRAARRIGDPPILVADPSLACELIGFEPRLSDIDTIVATAWEARK